MTSCAEKQALLNALIDGELDAANAAELDRHVASCAECTQTLDRLRAVRERILSAADVRNTAPDALRARIAAMGAPPARTRPTGAPWHGWLGGALGGAMAASLVFSVAIARSSEHALEDQIVASHVRSLLPGRLIDVATSDRHVVKPWFNGRVDFAPPVVDLKNQGFALVGGRLDFLDGHRAAVLVYRRGAHIINLVIAPATRLSLWTAHSVDRDGYHLRHWRRGVLDFWAVSDTDPEAIEAFRQVYSAATR